MKKYYEMRAFQFLSLLKNWKKLCASLNTYYPEEARKSALRIYFDQLRLIWKNGFYEPFYFLYGFDRKGISNEIMDSYLSFIPFQKKINALNTVNPFEEYSKYCGRVITADKYYFYLFCSALNIPAVDVLLYSKYGKLLYSKSVSPNLKDALLFWLDKRGGLFIKLSGGELGIGAMLVKKGENGSILLNNKKSSFEDLMDALNKGDFIVQPILKQHDVLNELSPYSVNTIRLQTVTKPDGSIMPFGALLRLGRKGNVVDNWAQGGVLVGIDMHTGKLKKYGFIKPGYGGKVDKHPDTLIKLEDFVVPYFDIAVSQAIQLHRHLYRCHSIGWDIAITNDGPVFIEGNGLWEISMAQIAQGGLKDMLIDYFNYENYK